MKIALCITGGFRKYNYEEIYKAYIEPNKEHDVKIYITTWDKTTKYTVVNNEPFIPETDIITYWDAGLSHDSHRRMINEDSTIDIPDEAKILNFKENMDNLFKNLPRTDWSTNNKLTPWFYVSAKSYFKLHSEIDIPNDCDIVIICRPDYNTPKPIHFLTKTTFEINGKVYEMKNNSLDSPYMEYVLQGKNYTFTENDEYLCFFCRDYGVLETEYYFGTYKAVKCAISLFDDYDEVINEIKNINIPQDTETTIPIQILKNGVGVFLINPEVIEYNKFIEYIQKAHFLTHNYLRYAREDVKTYLKSISF